MRPNGFARGLIASLFLSSMAAWAPGPRTARPQTTAADWPDAPATIQLFVRDAIADRLAAGNIPDLDLRPGQNRVLNIRREMPRAHMRLNAISLPHVEGFTLTLRTVADLQSDFDAGDTRMFITADSVSMGTDGATVRLGTDILIPTGSGRVKMCCCSATASYAQVKGAWTFQAWNGMVCSAPQPTPARARPF